VRVQENNLDTIMALAQRTFGAAYQFVPPMSVTLGIKECLSARKVRLFSDTGAWKQTALRVALFWPGDCRISDQPASGTPGCPDHSNRRDCQASDQPASGMEPGNV